MITSSKIEANNVVIYVHASAKLLSKVLMDKVEIVGHADWRSQVL